MAYDRIMNMSDDVSTNFRIRKAFRKSMTWAAARYRRRNERDGVVSRYAAIVVGLFAAAAASIQIAGIPTGLGMMADQLVFMTIAALAAFGACYILAIVLTCLHVPLPRQLTALTCLLAGGTFAMLHYAEFGWLASLVISLSYTLLGLALGCVIGLLVKSRLKPGLKAMAWISVAGTAALVMSAFWWAEPAEWPARDARDAVLEPQALDAANPSLQGSFDVSTYTYGSGKDKHREAFGAEADYITSSANASAYIQQWPRLRTAFWGFDQSALPVNGRVWMPGGEGPFPLALIVHGNHLMEDFSDDGYEYLGELLASRGVIAISVDANFLNYSVWSGIPNDDMKMRAWLLLKHLQAVNAMDDSGATVFSGKVDWSSVAMIGHSRGGQAAAMAADWKRWFDKDKELWGLDQLNIVSVVAIAPVDRSVDKSFAELEDINYLTIQGAKDADVNNFYGDRQYNRVTFSGSQSRFKASVYIENANHSQFNTSWGRMDERLPGGLFLNHRELLPASEQRKIAQVYISSFLEATLNGNDDYMGLFQDYRSGAHWLPTATRYLSRYESSDFVEITRFDDDAPLVKETAADDIMVVENEEIVDRDGNPKGATGLILEWEEPGAEFEIVLSNDAKKQLKEMEGGSFVFAVSNLEWDLIRTADAVEKTDNGYAADRPESMADGADGNVAGVADSELPPLPVVEVVLTERSGEELVLLLDDIAPIEPPSYTSFLSIGWLEEQVKDSKYDNPVEEVLRTVVAPIHLFGEDNVLDGARGGDEINPGDIQSIRFRFLTGPGKIRINEIGFLPEGGSYVQYES